MTKITKKYLKENPNHIFVFGDNLLRKGKGGAALLRDEPNTYGFITKKRPDHNLDSYYHPDEYYPIFNRELNKLIKLIEINPNKIFLISKLGGGLANNFNIYETVIKSGLQILNKYPNVKFI
jgi:hypothetical protein